MRRMTTMEPRFVELMPSDLDRGILYISTEHVITVHLCACGCDHKVTLPLHPQQWAFTFNGESVSLYPSVGNVAFPCRSHYWIKEGRIRWAAQLTEEEIQRGIARDRRALSGEPEQQLPPVGARVVEPGRWRRFWRRVSLRRS
jgi:hypothetical protein